MTDLTMAASCGPSPKAEQVLQAAARMFMEHGYGATSMDAIAREAGVSKATLYAHFANKDRLFAAIVSTKCSKFSETLEALDLEQLDTRAALLLIGRHFLRLILSPEACAIYRMVVAEAPRFPELGQIFYASGPAIVTGRLAQFLRQAEARGQVAVPDPVLTAKQFIGALQGPFHMRRLISLIDQPDEASLHHAVETAVDVFLRAYAKAPTGHGPAAQGQAMAPR